MKKKTVSRSGVALWSEKSAVVSVASFVICLSVFLTGGLALAQNSQNSQDPSWPLSKLVGPQAPLDSGQDTDFLNLIDSGKENWQSLFVNRIVNPKPGDLLGPYRSQENPNGVLGARTVPDVPGGNWSYLPDLNASLTFYFNSFEIFGDHHPCIFEQKGCLRKYISGKADNIDLYNRCNINVMDQMAKYNFSKGTQLYHSRKDYQKAEKEQENDIAEMNRACDAARVSESTRYWQKFEAAQKKIEDIAFKYEDIRPKVAESIVNSFERNPPQSDHEACSAVNQLLSVGLMDPNLFVAHDLESKVMNLLYQNGMVFEFSEQLALFADAVAQVGGADALKSDPTLKKLRRMQIELYAQYSLLRQGATATQSPGGMFDLLDVTQDHPDRPIGRLAKDGRLTVAGTLNRELLFLLQAYHNDYPQDPTPFHIGKTTDPSNGSYLSQQQLAQAMEAKVLYRSADRHETDQSLWDEEDHPKECRGIAGTEQRIACLNQFSNQMGH